MSRWQIPAILAHVFSAADEPRLLQTASVLGREFSPRLLETIWDGSGDLAPLLMELKRLEFLYEQTGAEEPLYVFKHALTQDVAYESLLTTRRQVLHEAAGRALETLYANRLEDAYDRLAYHYDHTDQHAKVVKYLTLMSEKATHAYAHAEAVTLLHQALVHAECLPDKARDYYVLDLIIRQGNSLFWSGYRQELVDLFLGYQEQLQGLQKPTLTGRYYYWLGFAYSFMGEREQAVRSLEHALETGRQCEDAVIMGGAHTLLTVEMFFTGSLQHSITHGRQAVKLFEGTEDCSRLGGALIALGLAYN